MGGFEGGIRVPSLISYPDRGWTGGKLLEPSTSMMDLYPTVLSLAGIETSKFSLTGKNETNHIGKKKYLDVLLQCFRWARHVVTVRRFGKWC